MELAGAVLAALVLDVAQELQALGLVAVGGGNLEGARHWPSPLGPRQPRELGEALQRDGGDRGGGGDQLGPELVALAGDVAQAQDLDAEHRRDHRAAEELEPHRVTRSAAMAAVTRAPGALDVAQELQELGPRAVGGRDDLDVERALVANLGSPSAPS